MHLLLFNIYLLLACGWFASTESALSQSLEEIVREKCLEKRGYKALDDNITFFRVVEAVSETEVSFPCSYCGEHCEDSARVWSWKSREANATEREVALGLGANLTSNRLFTLPDHSLTIRNVTTNDTGMYYCRSRQEDESVVFQFTLDLVLPEIPVEKEINRKSWEMYVGRNITEINKIIYQKNNTELINLLDKVKVKVASEWDPWLTCDGCLKLRKRFAKCRLRVKLNRVKYPDRNESNLGNSQKLLYRSIVVSCHSLDLAKWFPYLFSLTSQVPNFLQTQPCYGDCLTENRALHEPKYHLNLKLDEGETQLFACPDTDFRSKITWKKDGLALKPMRSQGKSHLKKFYNKIPFRKQPLTNNADTFVDRMNILHLSRVTYKDTAMFVCYVNNLPVKGFNVTVTSADETQLQRYYHYWLLSCYSMLLSTTIVALGIIWGCWRKDLFLKIPDDLLIAGKPNGD